MLKNFNSSLISIFTKLLILFVIAKAISLIIWWYLPDNGVELSIKENYQPNYKKIDFKYMIKKPEIKKEEKIKKAQEAISGVGISITNMILKGLYGNSTKGFIIIAMKSTPKQTDIIAIGEIYKGYKLKSIGASSVTFEKDSQDYILYSQKIDSKNKSSITKIKKNIKTIKHVNSNAINNVSRKDIEHYSNNPKQIWKDISIKEIKDGKKITGFKVTRINPKSKFATLGLKKNDLIIKANNIVLRSYRDVLEIYKHISKLDTVQIVVIRNNQEVELVYEIN